MNCRLDGSVVLRNCGHGRGRVGMADTQNGHFHIETRFEPILDCKKDNVMTYQRLTQAATCGCGVSKFNVDGVPIARFKCHCTICQSLYKKPFADVVMLWGGAIALPDEQPFTFRKYRPPPALQRATCNACGAPVVGFLRLAPFVRLAFVQCANFSNQDALPPPSVHIFYNSRVQDVADDLPKISGYWASEIAVTKLLMSSPAK